MYRSTRRRRLIALGLIPAMAFTVGCGKAADKLSEKAAEKAVENATGGDVDIDADGKVRIETEDGSYQTDGDGNVRIETEDGTYTAGQGLPEGWPDDVPIPDGATVAYGAASADGLMATINADGAPADVYDELKKALDGWKVEDEYSVDSTDGDMRSARFLDGEREVAVSVMSSGEGDGSVLSITYKATAA